MHADAKGGKSRRDIREWVGNLPDQALERARKPDREIIVVGHRSHRTGPPSVRIEKDVGEGERRNRSALDFRVDILVGNYPVFIDWYGKKMSHLSPLLDERL